MDFLRRSLVVLLVLLSCSAYARSLSASLEYRIRSNVSDVTTFGNVADNLDYSWPVEMSAPTQIYRADRIVGTASADVMGLVGSLTNAIGETVTFSTVNGLYIQEVSGLGTLAVSGFATATIQPLGTLAMTGAYSTASAPTITISTTATTTYRIWIVGK